MTTKPLTVIRRHHISAYEARMENAVFNPSDLYKLDGNTLLRNRDGRIETFDAELTEE